MGELHLPGATWLRQGAICSWNDIPSCWAFDRWKPPAHAHYLVRILHILYLVKASSVSCPSPATSSALSPSPACLPSLTPPPKAHPQYDPSRVNAFVADITADDLQSLLQPSPSSGPSFSGADVITSPSPNDGVPSHANASTRLPVDAVTMVGGSCLSARVAFHRTS